MTAEYYRQRCNDLREQIAEQERVKQQHSFTERDAQEALQHHLQQLEKLGATLEDDVCNILRKAIAQARANAEIEHLQQLLSSNLRELNNVEEYKWA